MKSMTGFATAEGIVGAAGDGGTRWRWDAKSVNNRGLDLKLRTPSALDAEEPAWRAMAAERFARGAVTLTLSLGEAGETAAPAPRLNPAALAEAAAWAAAAEAALAEAGATSRGVAPEALLQLRGVLEAPGAERPAGRGEGVSPALATAVREGLARALAGLAAARAEEGARLKETLGRLVDEIAAQTGRAEAAAAARQGGIKAKLKERVAALLAAGAPLEEGRLAQELAQLAVKLDVREELDRLAVHIAAARDLLEEGAPVGRRLEFLTQELNREANTLCAKSQDVALTEIGLALKVAIDQVKEQAANVE